MSNQNPKDSELHERNYVMEHFQHLMTDAERAAANAIVFIVEEEGQKTVHATFG